MHSARILTLENASDLQALRLLAANHFSDHIPYITLETPCMFNVGMKVFVEYSIKHPDKIVLSSTCEEIISNLHTDSAWTSYKPLGASYRNVTEGISEELIYLKEINLGYIHRVIEPPLSEIYNVSPNDWLSLSIKSKLMTKESEITSKALAVQFQVTQSMVVNSIEKIKNEIIDSEQSFLLMSNNLEAKILKENIYKISSGNSSNLL